MKYWCSIQSFLYILLSHLTFVLIYFFLAKNFSKTRTKRSLSHSPSLSLYCALNIKEKNAKNVTFLRNTLKVQEQNCPLYHIQMKVKIIFSINFTAERKVCVVT